MTIWLPEQHAFCSGEFVSIIQTDKMIHEHVGGPGGLASHCRGQILKGPLHSDHAMLLHRIRKRGFAYSSLDVEFHTMSLLAPRAVATMLAANAVNLDGRQCVSRQIVTDALGQMLRQQGLSSKEVRVRIRSSWERILPHDEQGATDSPALAQFVGLVWACRVAQDLGFDVPLDIAARNSSEAVIIDDHDADMLVEVEVADAAAASCEPASEIVEILEDEACEENEATVANHADDALVAQLAELSSLSHADLVAKCTRQMCDLSKKDKKIKELQAKSRNLAGQLGRAKRQTALAVIKAKAAKDDCFAMQKLGKQKAGRAGRWSLQSKFSAALRRSLTNIAACDFGIVSMLDMSKQTVLRCEILTGSAIVNLTRNFSAEGLGSTLALESGSEEPVSEDNFNLYGVGFTCDATNTNIWRRKKLHVLECEILFLSDPKKLSEGDFESAVSVRHCVSFDCISACVHVTFA